MVRSNTGIFQNIYKLVESVPKGKVMTYGNIAKKLGVSPIVVGWALHANRDLTIPCHRVVDKKGRVAANFAFGGGREQRRRLMVEDVTFIDEKHIDLEKHLLENSKSKIRNPKQYLNSKFK